MDLDLWDCLGRKKTLSYNRRNMVECFLNVIEYLKEVSAESDVFLSLTYTHN